MSSRETDRPLVGIAFILVGVVSISLNDMVIKFLSGGYPLHQMVFIRSVIGILFSLAFLQFEGGFRSLWPARPGLQLLRALLIVFANMTFFAGLAVLPLGEATAVFFVAPLFITLLSIPVLGEPVGPRRLGAVVAGFVGVLVMMWTGGTGGGSAWLLALPLVAALAYAGMQVLTRKLAATARASAMAVYVQSAFIAVSAGFYLVAGDGRFAAGVDSPSLQFLLRAWVWPTPGDWWLLGGTGALAGIIGYCLSQAYRIADAGIIAPFEYVTLPLALVWGWLIFGEVLTLRVGLGVGLIMGAGLYVFWRERAQARPIAARGPTRR